MGQPNEIPDAVVRYLQTLLYVCYHISEVDVEKKSLAGYLRPEYLAKVVGNERAAYVQALSWVTDHPEYPYRELLPNIRFSNEDCVKLLQIFLSHIKTMDQHTPNT